MTKAYYSDSNFGRSPDEKELINLVTKAYYSDSNFGRSPDEKELSMWKMYNLLTGANKSSYIDNFLDRSLNAGELSSGICRAIKGDDEYSWFIR